MNTNKVIDIVSKIGCFFLSIILFFVICIFLSLEAVPKIVNKENVYNIVSDIDVESILNEHGSTAMNDLYKIADDNNVDRSVINGIANSNEFKELVGNYYGEMVEAILYDGVVKDITSEQIISTVEDVLDRTANDLGYTITEEQRNNIMSQVEEKAPQIASSLPTYDRVTKDLNNEDIKAIQTVLSNESRIVLIVTIIILATLIALFRWSIYRFAIWTGTTTIIAGGVFLVFGSAANIVFKDLGIEMLTNSINTFIQNGIFSTIINLGLVTVLIGVIQIIYYIVMNKKAVEKRV